MPLLEEQWLGGVGGAVVHQWLFGFPGVTAAGSKVVSLLVVLRDCSGCYHYQYNYYYYSNLCILATLIIISLFDTINL